jgi:hypothetical protein
MKHAQCLLWGVVVILSACLNPIQAESDIKSQDESNPVALKPVADSEKEIECRVLDMNTGETTTVEGRQVIYMSGPRPSYNHRIRVTAFSYQGTHWIGLSGDLFIYRKGIFIGMAINGEGLAWLTNFASNLPNRSLNEEIQAFQHEVSLAELGHAFLRKWQRDSRSDEPKGWTNFGEVIRNPYIMYLYTNGGSMGMRPKFVSGAVDGDLLKVTVSNHSGGMFPNIWIDLDTKKAVKADNYEYDPDAELREFLKWAPLIPHQDEAKSTSTSLQPASGTEKEVECRVLDMSTGETTTVKGRQAIYLSEPHPPSTSHHPMAVSEFSYRDVRWVGLNADLYLYYHGHLIGMKVVRSGFIWLSNYADNSRNRSLTEEIQAFERDVTLKQLFDAYHRSLQIASQPGDPVSHTSFSEVIPQKYNEYLQRSGRGMAGLGIGKFVSAEVDGKLLKVTVSDQSGVIFPTLWIDLNTKKAVKAENYKYDPDTKDR